MKEVGVWADVDQQYDTIAAADVPEAKWSVIKTTELAIKQWALLPRPSLLSSLYAHAFYLFHYEINS